MDLGAAAEGVGVAAGAFLLILSWPVWIMALFIAGFSVAERSVRAAVIALLTLAGLHVGLFCLGAWEAMFNPFSASPLGSTIWSGAFILASVVVVGLSGWGTARWNAARRAIGSEQVGAGRT